MFGKPNTYDHFPQADDITVEVAQINGFDNKPYRTWDKTRTLGKAASQNGWIECFNKLCKHGAINFMSVIDETIQGKKSSFQTRVLCQGYIPGASRTSRPCYTSYQITIRVKYKESDQNDQPR